MAATDQPRERHEAATPGGAAQAQPDAHGDPGARMDPTTSSLGEMVSDGGVPPAPGEVEPVTTSGVTDSTRRSGVDSHPASAHGDAGDAGDA